MRVLDKEPKILWSVQIQKYLLKKTFLLWTFQASEIAWPRSPSEKNRAPEKRDEVKFFGKEEEPFEKACFAISKTKRRKRVLTLLFENWIRRRSKKEKVFSNRKRVTKKSAAKAARGILRKTLQKTYSHKNLKELKENEIVLKWVWQTRKNRRFFRRGGTDQRSEILR